MRNLAIGLLSIVLAQGTVAAQTPQEQGRILRAFQASVADYTVEHHCFGQLRVPLATVTPGSPIFTPPVATVFRQVIARALDDQAPVRRMTGVGGALPLEHHPVVFEPFPATELHEFPTLLARVLPPLPRPLEYRLIGNDLVLRDADRDVIVAVLRGAIGTVPTGRR